MGGIDDDCSCSRLRREWRPINQCQAAILEVCMVTPNSRGASRGDVHRVCAADRIGLARAAPRQTTERHCRQHQSQTTNLHQKVFSSLRAPTRMLEDNSLVYQESVQKSNFRNPKAVHLWVSMHSREGTDSSRTELPAQRALA